MAIYPGGKNTSDSFVLGAETNIFDAGTDDLTEAEALRDAYATANASWLASYDNNSSLNIQLMYFDGDNYIVQYQVRVNDTWYNNGSATGVRGASGAGTDFSGITENHIPAIGSSSVPYDSGLFVDTVTNDVTTGGSIQTGPGSLRIGSNFTMSSGVQAVALTLGNGTTALGLNCEYDETGSTTPFYFKLGSQSTLHINTTSDTKIEAPFSIEYDTVGNNITTDFIIMPYEAGELEVTFYDGSDCDCDIIFDEIRTITEAEVGTEVTFGVGNPYLLSDSTSIFVTMTGIDLYGGVAGENDYLYGETTPFFKSHAQPYTKTSIVENNPSYIRTIKTGDKSLSSYTSGTVVKCDIIQSTNDTITYDTDEGSYYISTEGEYVFSSKLHIDVVDGYYTNYVELWFEESDDGDDWGTIAYSGEYREISSAGEGAFETSFNITVSEAKYFRIKARDAGSGSPALKTYTLNNNVVAPSATISVSRVSNT